MCKAVAEAEAEALAAAMVEPLPPRALFQIENLTVCRAPLLKVYYWEFFDIDSLNEKIGSDLNVLNHSIKIPTRQINSKPLKTIFWLRNTSDNVIELRLKRVKNCDCKPLQTRVGFNQFRNLYHCPHRRLIHILQEFIVMKPNDLVALSVVSYYFLFGEHTLCYEINLSDSRMIALNFHVDIIGFDPLKCIMTKELIPVDIKEYRRFVQPIWVRNITMQNMNLVYTSRERGLKLLNPNLTVPRQSVWPLMVEYRPSDYDNQLELNLHYENGHTKCHLKATGTDAEFPEDSHVPIEDYDSTDFPYVVYPNKLDFNVEQSEDRSLMVSIHNYNQKSVEFRWQDYIINDLFEVSFVPNIFRLKPHHSRLCVVKLRVHERPLHFKRVPTVLEVHKIFDKATKIAKELLEEVESIDDPKWKEDSYLEHVFLHLNIKVNFKKEEIVELKWEPPPPKKERMAAPPKQQTSTIFEKLYWEYLSKSNFMRTNKDPEITDGLSYDNVLQMQFENSLPATQESIPTTISKSNILNILSQLMAECVYELSKNWRFVPIEYAEEVG